MENSKNRVNRLILLCSFIYFTSYITRINYGAVIAEMVTSTGLTKSALSIALTGGSVAYGAGQLISGYFGDKIQPKKLIALGLITSTLMNLCIPLCTSPAQMTIVWCVNGFAQAFMWPPLVKFMSSMFSQEDYSRGCVRVSWGSSVGTIFVYLISPFLIAVWGWRSVFLICAAMGGLGLLLWCKSCPIIELTDGARQGENGSVGGRAILPVIVLVMIAIVLQGILRDGVATWMPSYISETYNLSNEISILTGVVMPVFGMACHQFSVYLYHKKIKNPLLCSATLFGLGAVSAVFLNLLQGGNVVFSVLLSSVLTGCMHGVNMMLICIVPPLVAKKGRVSVVSGLFNSCTYVGSAISTYGMALVTEKSGWSMTIFFWLLAALAGTLLCCVCVPAWKGLGRKQTDDTWYGIKSDVSS